MKAPRGRGGAPRTMVAVPSLFLEGLTPASLSKADQGFCGSLFASGGGCVGAPAQQVTSAKRAIPSV